MQPFMSFRNEVPSIAVAYSQHLSFLFHLHENQQRPPIERFFRFRNREIAKVWDAIHFGIPVHVRPTEFYHEIRAFYQQEIEKALNGTLSVKESPWRDMWLDLLALSLIAGDDELATWLAESYHADAEATLSSRHSLESSYIGVLAANFLRKEQLPSTRTMLSILKTDKKLSVWADVFESMQTKDAAAFSKAFVAAIASHAKSLAKEVANSYQSMLCFVPAIIVWHVGKKLGLVTNPMDTKTMALIWTAESLSLKADENADGVRPMVPFPLSVEQRSVGLRDLNASFQRAGVRFALYPKMENDHTHLEFGYRMPIVVETQDKKLFGRLAAELDHPRFYLNPMLTSTKKSDAEIDLVLDFFSGMRYPLLRIDPAVADEAFSNPFTFEAFGVEVPSIRPEWLLALQLKLLEEKRSKVSLEQKLASHKAYQNYKGVFDFHCNWVKQFPKMVSDFDWSIPTKVALKEGIKEALVCVRK